MAGDRFSVTALIGVDSSTMKRGLAKAGARLKRWAKTAMGAVARVAKAGMMIAGAAVGAFAVKSVREFASFQQGMQEVFTLLPGMSKDAMASMEDDVIKLSNKMGVLPEEIVPSLYQALSAGIPAGNVFDFLEVSIKGAKAGVATTAESVDLLTSVTNAYGRENLSVAKASDIIFTTIKEGKTTFTELAGAIYQVGPVAANAGVSFQDVGAAIASLTAQGVPTRVATTQIRQAILALASPNKNLAETLANTTGNIYEMAEMMKKPGGLLKAFERLKEHASGDAMNIKGFMGSVEGLQAMMAITAKGGEKFTQTMIAMGGAAGATGQAYDTMNTGIARAFEKLRAGVKVTFIKMGKSLAPFIEAAAPFFMRIIKLIQSIPWTKILQGFARVWLIGIKPYADAIWTMLNRLPWHLLIETLLPIAKLVVKSIQNVGSAIIRLGPMLIPALRALAGYFGFIMLKWFLLTSVIKKFAPEIAQIFRAIFQTLAKAFEFIINPSAQKFRDLVELIKSRFGHLGKSVQVFFEKVKEFLISNFKIIADGIIAGFGKVLGGVWAQVKEFLMGHGEVSRAVERFKAVWQELKEEVVPALAELKQAVQELFVGVSAAFAMGEAGTKAQKTGLQSLISAIALVITAVTAIIEIFGKLFIGIMRVAPVFLTLAKDILPMLKYGLIVILAPLALLVAVWAAIQAALVGVIWGISKLVAVLVDLLKWLKPVYEAFKILLKVLHLALKAFWHLNISLFKSGFSKLREIASAFWTFFKEAINSVADFWKKAFSVMWKIAKAAMTPIFTLFDFLKKKVWDVLFGGTVTKDFKKAFEFIGNLVSRIINGIISAFERMKNIAAGIFGGIFKLAEKAIAFAAKVAKGAGGVLGSIAGKLGFGGGGAGVSPVQPQLKGMDGGNSISTALKPVITKLTSIDNSLKNIDKTLRGKFVNQ